MAIDTGLIKAVSGANQQFLDVRESFGKSFEETFSGINATVKAEKDRLDALEKKRAKQAEELYRDAPLVEENKVPEKFRSAFTKKAMDLKKGYAELISNKANMDPMEFIDEQNKYKATIDDINKQVNALGQWQAGYIQANGETGNELLSQSTTAEEQETIDKIFNGDLPMEYREGKMGFVNNGEFIPIDNLPKLKEKATKEHLTLQNLAENIGEKLGAKGEGADSSLYKYEIDKLKENISQLGDDQIDSLFADYTGLAGEKGFAASYLKGMSKPEKIERIFNHYKQAADTGVKVYSEYIKRNREKDTDKDFLTKAERSKIISARPTANKIQQAALTVKTPDQFKQALKSISVQKGSSIVTRKQAQEGFIKENLIKQKEEEKKAKLAGVDFTPKTKEELKSEFNDLHDASVSFFVEGDPLEVDFNNPNSIRQALWGALDSPLVVKQHYTATDLATNVPEANQTPSQPQPESEEATQDQTTITSASGNPYDLRIKKE